MHRRPAAPDPTSPHLPANELADRASAGAPPILGQIGLPPVRVTDATSHPLGIVVLDRHHEERVVTLIPKSTAVPCEKKGRFAYAYDNMTAVRVEVTEGAGSTRDEVKVIAEVILEDLPPRPKGTPIDVVYRYGVNQILEIDIVDVESRRVRRARMDLRGELDSGTLDEAKKNVASFQVH